MKQYLGIALGVLMFCSCALITQQSAIDETKTLTLSETKNIEDATRPIETLGLITKIKISLHPASPNGKIRAGAATVIMRLMIDPDAAEIYGLNLEIKGTTRFIDIDGKPLPGLIGFTAVDTSGKILDKGSIHYWQDKPGLWRLEGTAAILFDNPISKPAEIAILANTFGAQPGNMIQVTLSDIKYAELKGRMVEIESLPIIGEILNFQNK